MWYTVLITLVIDVGGLLLVYAVLRDRIRRATSAAAQIAELREEVSRLVVELNQTTERNVALIEDRISGLTEILAAADKKIGLLHREIEKHDVGTQVYSRLVEGRQQAVQAREQVPPAPQVPPLSVELSEKADRRPGARSPAAPGQDAAGGERAAQRQARSESGARATVSGSAPVEGASPRQDLHQRVMMLSRSGFSAALIAGRVGIPLGEVELIISLERQRMSQPAPQQDEDQT